MVRTWAEAHDDQIEHYAVSGLGIKYIQSCLEHQLKARLTYTRKVLVSLYSECCVRFPQDILYHLLLHVNIKISVKQFKVRNLT